MSRDLYRQTLHEAIAAFEAASSFDYGVFAPDYDFCSPVLDENPASLSS